MQHKITEKVTGLLDGNGQALLANSLLPQTYCLQSAFLIQSLASIPGGEGGRWGTTPLGINYEGAKYVWAPSGFICFICFDIKICRLLNVEEKYSCIRPRALCFEHKRKSY